MSTRFLRPSRSPGSTTLRARGGFSLVEVLVGVSIFAVGLLVVAGAAGRGIAESSKARQDMEYVSDLYQVSDSLLALGYGKVATGSASIRGRAVSWKVTALGTNGQLVTMSVQRKADSDPTRTVTDVVALYLAKPNPGS
jgi:prepilin-type N-terminal cleavage/methylation domain-containing protein